MQEFQKFLEGQKKYQYIQEEIGFSLPFQEDRIRYF